MSGAKNYLKLLGVWLIVLTMFASVPLAPLIGAIFFGKLGFLGGIGIALVSAAVIATMVDS